MQLVLDIGTHKVLGLVARPREEGGVEILASTLKRHPGRAMRDGQVHDVPAVARLLRQVKAELEKAVGVSFTGAHIAAAGRALRTVRGRAEQVEPGHVQFTEGMQRQLEWEAVADAQLTLLQSLPPTEQPRGYYCIAHSPVGYWVDSDPIGLLVGQRGQTFAAEVIATFLPGAVVDSLEAALAEAGLEMVGLTLEPIAALEAVVPPTMRHLNLVLVDVGAGTSDIALTGGGVVQAFAMVPRAGDVVTEAISKALLLDFAVAEQVKREVSSNGSARVENVLGDEVEVTGPVLEEVTRDVVEQLAQEIAREVLQWSPGTPDALLLVGGGSQGSGLAGRLAGYLDLPPQRVALRDRRAVRNVAGGEELQGPDTVVALGIALRAARLREMPPVRVRVDGRPVCLFLPDRCTVREAVRIAGVQPHQVAGRIGAGLTATVNGHLVVVPGTTGREAKVQVNGQPAALDTVLHNQDDVRLEPAEPGRPPRVTVQGMVERWLKEAADPGGGPVALPRIRWGGGPWQDVPLLVRRNGRPTAGDALVSDRDVLEIRIPRNAAELREAMGIAEGGVELGCRVGGKPVRWKREPQLLRNGRPAEEASPVEDGDVWEVQFPDPPRVRDVLAEAGVPQAVRIQVRVNGEPVSVEVPARVRRNGAPANLGDEVRDGDHIEVDTGGQITLYQVLPSVTAVGQGRRVSLYVGGRPAGFTTPIAEGDDITVRYE